MDMDNEVFRILGKIEGKLDGLLSSRAEDKERLDKHELRLSSVEQKWAKIAGACILVSFLIPILLKYL